MYLLIEDNELLDSSFFLFHCFNVRNKYKLPHKSYEVPKNNYKGRSYLKVNQKLFRVIENFLNYFGYAIKLFS